MKKRGLVGTLILALVVIVLIVAFVAVMGSGSTTGYAISSEDFDRFLTEQEPVLVQEEERVVDDSEGDDVASRIIREVVSVQDVKKVSTINPRRADFDDDGDVDIKDAIATVRKAEELKKYGGKERNFVRRAFDAVVGKEGDADNDGDVDYDDVTETVKAVAAASTGSSASPFGALPASAGPSVPVTCPGPFIRGDANGDGTVNIADTTTILSYLFGSAAGISPIVCIDAGDANDDNRLDVADSVYVLSYLFGGGTSSGSSSSSGSGALPPPPFPNPGFDPTPRNNTGGNNQTNGTQTMHLECIGMQCVSVAGPGINECATNLDCMNNNNTGGNNQTNTTNLADIVPASTYTYQLGSVLPNGLIPVEVNVTFENIGNQATPSFNNLVNLTSTSSFNSQQLYFFSTGIPAGGSNSVKDTFNLTSGHNYSVMVWADSNDVVNENNENNNIEVYSQLIQVP